MTGQTATVPAPAPRYLALDAFRGAVMIVLVSHAFGLAGVPGLATQFDHRAWEGLAFWDLILPAFFFIVGAAMPFALARRGASLGRSAKRSAKLIVLAVIVSSAPSGRLHSPVMEVLFHIAFTYFFCYLILRLRFRWQVACAALILGGHLALFLLYPGAAGPFSKGDNIGAVLDKAVLGSSHPGFYASLNIVPGIVSTLFGAWTALLLKSGRAWRQKFAIMAVCVAAALACSMAISPWVPVIKRIYTLSYTLLSAGCILLVMIAFAWVIEVKGYHRWTFPLTVVGVNCIFVYALFEMLGGWLNRAVGAFTGNFTTLGILAPVAQSCATLAVIWYVCYWLYRRNIVFKL
ncbi:MAG TPA: heparan-alpha-glucosaminide N-acetyltransferase domain-containing protein [Bryobacteraceae bacterium]|nr:heparan-alpha-glucosaminide N-acetyltransferase domain-containing protein [Bryobacteraceae bacterium]